MRTSFMTAGGCRHYQLAGSFLRLTRQATAVHVQYLEPGGPARQWKSLRLGYLPIEGRCQVGLMACSPERGGLTVCFTDFRIVPSDGINLHP